MKWVYFSLIFLFGNFISDCQATHIHLHGTIHKPYCGGARPTEEQAQASIALAQLSQLIAVYNDGWVPDWKDGDCKYNIEGYEDKFLIENRSSWISFLTFKTKPLAELFLQNFKDLITIAKPLL